MASSDAKEFPVKGKAYRVTFPILDADGDLVAGAAGLDSEISKDGGTFTDCTNEATQIATSSGMYYLDLTATEMNADTVALIIKTSTDGAKTTPIVLYPMVITAGGTWTFDKILKVIAAWAVGNWRDKSGSPGVYELLDPDDGSTVIAEITPSESTPQKQVTIL